MFGDQKVAVCISGLTRTGIQAAKSFSTFFENYGYDVFFHTWHESDEISDTLIKLYKPKRVKIDIPLDKREGYVNKGSFESMFFSMMCANDLKKEHEIIYGFRYDIVVRHRFDVIFDPASRFHVIELGKRTVYSHGMNMGHVNVDYHHHGINDLFFYGDSESMDIVSDSFKTYAYAWNDIRINISIGMKVDSGDAYLSPGQAMYKIAADRNIRWERITGPMSGYFPAIWRPWVCDLDPKIDFEKIRNSRYQCASSS